MKISRRSLVQRSAAAGAAAMLPNALLAEKTPPANDQPTVIAHLETGLLRVTGGQIGGFMRNGIYTYKGIPYAASTEGENRFMAPRPATPWAGVRSARSWGPECPQPSRGDGRHNDAETFMFEWLDATNRVYAAGSGEDCLSLNVWTPGIQDGKKRPVMFWIHGGGFTNGSAHEQLSYDGENLARRGDVVLVSVNHRLNSFGFLDLSSYGPQYSQSANAGMLDLVAALTWVRNNIAAFGGDPGCVTIFGQSGGGDKVSALMGMPLAKGLFHRAIAESGSMLRAMPQERSRAFADEIVAELGLSRESIERIHTMPWDQVLAATAAAIRKQAARPAKDRLAFGPVLDGDVIPAHPFDPKASELSADVPLIVGTTLNEFTSATNRPELTQMTDAELREKVQQLYPDRTDAILKTFAETMPGSTPWHRWWVIATVPMRTRAIAHCTAKAALGKAPAYLYWFVWQTPILDATPGAFHCSEIAFVFNNTDRCDTMTGGGARPRALAHTMSDAWVQFARTGNPGHAGMAEWKPFSSGVGEVMVFDDRTRLELDPDKDQRKSVTG